MKSAMAEAAKDSGSYWLVEKAHNKEFGDWMVVERRKKKNAGANKNSNQFPPNREHSRNKTLPPKQTQRPQRQVSISQHFAQTKQPARFEVGSSSNGARPGTDKEPNKAGENSIPRPTGVRILPRNLNPNGRRQAQYSSIVIREPQQVFEQQITFLGSGTTTANQDIQANNLSNGGGGTHGDRPGGLGNSLSKRHDASALDPESDHRNSVPPVSGTVTNIANDKGRTDSPRDGNTSDILGTGSRHTHSVHGGQQQDGLAEDVLESLGASSTKSIDLGGVEPTDIDMDGMGD